MRTIKEMEMLAAKLVLLLKELDEGSKVYAPVQAIDTQSMCKVCGNGGHLGNDYPVTHEDVAFMNNNNNNNNGYRPQGGQGWNQSRQSYQGGGNSYNSNFNSNQPSLKDLALGQAKIN
jgi:hypothetical protein